MHSFLLHIINTFGYDSLADFSASVSPSSKYAGLSIGTLLISWMSSTALRVFGLDVLAFGCLLAVFAFELITGLARATKVKEPITSMRFSRFVFKASYYLLILAIAHLFASSFSTKGNETAAMIFNWMHLFFSVQIVLENIVSISENIAVITGREKAHWISILQNKVNNFFKL